MPKEEIRFSKVLEQRDRVNVRVSTPKIRKIGRRLCSPSDLVTNEFIPVIQKMRKTKQLILERDQTRRDAGELSDRMYNASKSKHTKDLGMLSDIETALFAASDALDVVVETIQHYAGS